MEREGNSRRALGMFVVSMLIFGTIGIFRRMIPLPSAFLAFARGIIGGVFLTAAGGMRKALHQEGATERTGGGAAEDSGAGTAGPETAGKSGRGLGLPIIIGIMIGMNWMLLFEAYNYTTVAVATLCYYMQPTIVMLLSPVLFRERMTWKKGVCAALSLAGMALVSGVAGGRPPQGDIRGVVLGLGAAALYAGVIIMNKKSPPMEARKKITVQLLSAGAAMIPYLLATGGFSGLTFSMSSAVMVMTVGIVHTGLAYLLYFSSICGLKVQTIALFSYIDPVSALIFSAVLLGEPMSGAGILGAVLIIGAAAAGERLQN